MQPATPIRIVLIDDHALVRDGIRSLLSLMPQFDVIGEAASGAEALELLQRIQPQILLMDIGLKDINGLELTRRLRQLYPALKVLILSMYDNQEYLTTSLEVGASGYVLKEAPSREIIAAIEAIAAGGSFFSAEIARKLARRAPEPEGLTPRERQVLLMLAQGLNNKNMAQALQISVRTVETHRLSIRRKLAIDKPADLVRHALEHGWVPDH
ncbi:MAG: response regulator transcription factor [Pseudomonas sp.]|uniref:response regulator n=1 Tax=Pseudomonas sp. TaxID=306 RepID=UPI003396B053